MFVRGMLLALALMPVVRCSPPEMRLMNDLLAGYVREERPVLDSTKPVVVTLGIAMQQIINLNEKEEQLEVSAWLRFTWRDENLRWQPSAYENVTDLRHPAGTLWQPDILLYNSVDPAFDSTYKVNLLNYHDGSVNWVPPGIFKISCKLDIYWFPFDEQFCFFKFGSWSFSRDKIELNVGDFDFSEYIPNGEWIILNSTANVSVKYYECCPEAYEDIKFTLHLRRRTLYYAFNLIMPCMLTMVLVVLGFTLSPETCEKVGLQISVSLAICIFLTIMNEMTPHTSEAVPLLGVFFQSCMVISVLATSFTVFVQSYHFRSQHNTLRMTFWMRFILLEWAPWLLRMEFPDRKNTIETMKESWSNRKQKRRGTVTAFDFVQADDAGPNCAGLAVKENLENFISKVSSKIKDDEKLLERLRVLQKIHDHVKMIRERSDDGIEESQAALEWRFAAIVVDRLGLLSFTFLICGTTLIICLRAPFLVA
ncbi:putative neuronal acetylcholine receptor subunit alpha-7 [Teladorsagia circumcincta]|uniref:Putative neuronal acetylcholine receptor subunit alpha-7 n=1 Tax=Teladorsagia circumcincta TaxID=45464 RepID=A0A2G9UH93_TELCI|nr:putative neuronal acetylcholine receptor subunit alpha-7 [Teladorsagia circumcincta]